MFWRILNAIGLRESVVQFMLVNALLALSIYLTLHTGMFSLANAGFMSIGAYVGVIATQHFGLPLGLALILGMLVAAVIALPLGAPVLRLSDIYLAIATIGFGEIVRIFWLNFDGLATSLVGHTVTLTGGALGIKGIPTSTKTWHLLLALAVTGYCMARLNDSRLGRAMSAIRQDEIGAAGVGINPVYVKLVVFVLSAMLAAAGGVLSSHLTRIISPGDFSFSRVVNILSYAVLGGTATWAGPIVGGLLLTALPEVARPLRQYNQIFTGLVLLLVIVYLPGGIIDPRLWARLRDRLAGKKRNGDEAAAAEAAAAADVADARREVRGLMTANRNSQQNLQLLVQDLTQQFAGLTALQRVNLAVETGAHGSEGHVVGEGRVVGLIGPNGAGKTTLINCISGLSRPTAGRILLNGRPLQSLPPHRINALGIARTYQNIRLFCDMTVLGNVLVGQHRAGRANLLDALFYLPRHRREKHAFRQQGLALLDRFGLAGKAGERAGSLPYGDQRRLEMARALASGPQLLLLDEPSAGMNAVETANVGEQILRARAAGLAVLLVEHDMALVGQVCDEVYVLNFGEVIAHGTPDEVKAYPGVVEAYLGKAADVQPPGRLNPLPAGGAAEGVA